MKFNQNQNDKSFIRTLIAKEIELGFLLSKLDNFLLKI